MTPLRIGTATNADARARSSEPDGHVEEPREKPWS